MDILSKKELKVKIIDLNTVILDMALIVKCKLCRLDLDDVEQLI